MTQEALKLALDALEDFSHKECCDNGEGEIGSRVCCEVLSYKAHDENCKVIKAITAIKEALAQEQEQEPVADSAFLERVLAAMEGVIDVADRKTNEFDALRGCIVDLTLMLHLPRIEHHIKG